MKLHEIIKPSNYTYTGWPASKADLKERIKNCVIRRPGVKVEINDDLSVNFICESAFRSPTFKNLGTHLPFKINSLNGCLDLYNHSALSSLVGCPANVGNLRLILLPSLKSLEGCPAKVKEDAVLCQLPIESLEGMPSIIGNSALIECPNVKSLVGINDIIKSVRFLTMDFKPIEDGGLAFILIPKLKSIGNDFEITEPFQIINKYLGTDNIIECQSELIEAGFEEYAQL